MIDYLKKNKVKAGWFITILTVILDIPAYFLLPDMMVVQIGLTQDATTAVKKSLFLFLMTLFSAFFAYLGTKTKNDPKMTWLTFSGLVFIFYLFVCAINLLPT